MYLVLIYMNISPSFLSLTFLYVCLIKAITISARILKSVYQVTRIRMIRHLSRSHNNTHICFQLVNILYCVRK
jgi:hypothetical protein